MCYPIPLEQAVASRVCRVCGRPIVLTGLPEAHYDEDTVERPYAITSRNGSEMAHTACLGEPECYSQGA